MNTWFIGKGESNFILLLGRSVDLSRFNRLRAWEPSSYILPRNLPATVPPDQLSSEYRWSKAVDLWINHALPSRTDVNIPSSCSFAFMVSWLIKHKYKFKFLSSFLVGLMPRTHCRYIGLLLHLFTFRDTHTHTPLGRTTPDEGSGRRRDLYLTTQYPKQTGIHTPGGIRNRSPSMRVAADLRL